MQDFQPGKPQRNTLIGTITGDQGVGKSTFAATFPDPIFITPEDGISFMADAYKPDALPLVTTFDDFWEQIKWVAHAEHEYQTLVIDSITALDQIFTNTILEGETVQSLNKAKGGYGAAYDILRQYHRTVRNWANICAARGMHVIFVAHADVETIELPDSDPYTRFTIRIPKKSLPAYVDDVDFVGFLRLETLVKGFEKNKKTGETLKKGKAVATGNRYLYMDTSASNITKNRFGVKEPLLVEEFTNPLLDLISIFNQGEPNE